MVTETRRRRKAPEWDIRRQSPGGVGGGAGGVFTCGVELDPEALEKTKEHCRLIINSMSGLPGLALAWTMGALFEVARGFYDGYLLATKPEKYRAWYSNFKVV